MKRGERQKAKDNGEKYYRSDKKCPYGHDSVRITSNGRCYQCSLDGGVRWSRENPEKLSEIGKDWRKRNWSDIEDKRMKQRYGIGFKEYYEILEQQRGECAICGSTTSGTELYERLVVDHCHDRNEVRGLLCFNCNIAIGKLSDSPDLLRKAAKYIEDSYEDSSH